MSSVIHIGGLFVFFFYWVFGVLFVFEMLWCFLPSLSGGFFWHILLTFPVLWCECDLRVFFPGCWS